MTFLESIASIPPVLERMVKTRSERMEVLERHLQKAASRRVVFIGSGSSYNSALAACPLFDRVGLDARVVYPNQFTTYTELVDTEALYVVISQGGSTKLVYEAVEKLHAVGCPVCSVTADLEAPIARACDVSIEMGCGEEQFLYRTVGVDATIVTCWQIALSMALATGAISTAEASAMDRELLDVICMLPDRRKQALAWYEDHKFSLMRCRYLMFAGANDLYSVAREADIKVMEMVPLVTRSFELEEIIHGPQNAFDGSGGYILFARKGVDAQKAQGIAAFLNTSIGFCSIVGEAGSGSRDCVFQEASERFGLLEYLTIAQVLAYKLADDHGRDLTRKLNAGINDFVSKVL